MLGQNSILQTIMHKYKYIYIFESNHMHTHIAIYLIKLHAYMLIGLICISMQINYLANCRQRKLPKVRGHLYSLSKFYIAGTHMLVWMYTDSILCICIYIYIYIYRYLYTLLHKLATGT